ncbi:MAG TPA: putative nucleotide-diphospho-sugar transferase [Rhizomicrobium sp.]
MNIEIERAVETIGAQAPSGPVAIVFANSAYREILHNWLRHAHAASFGNIVVCALDDALAAEMSDAGIACSTINGGDTLAQLWVRRAHLFAALCRARIDFIHSDADAVWLQNPVERSFSLGVDVAFSQGTVWPYDIVEEWSFVVCCGFFAVRAGPRAAVFFDTVSERTEKERDDQIAVNRALRETGMVWQKPGKGQTRDWSGRKFRIFDEPIIGAGPTLAAAILPHREFPRLPEMPNGALVAHPLSPKTAPAKTEMLRDLGLWLG